MIKSERQLHHGDRIELGVNHFFRLNCPVGVNGELERLNKIKSENDFNFVQEEILLSKMRPNDEETASTDDGDDSPSSTVDDSDASMHLAVRKIKHCSDANMNFSFMSKSSSSSSSLGRSFYKIVQNNTNDLNKLNGRGLEDNEADEFLAHQRQKRLRKLREMLLRANSLAREANSLCKEMGTKIRFTVSLRIPAYNLTPCRKDDSFLSEPAILVKPNNSTQEQSRIAIDLEKFENYLVSLREAYNEQLKQTEPIEVSFILNLVNNSQEREGVREREIIIRTLSLGPISVLARIQV